MCPRKLDGERRRQQILDNATSLFALHGIYGTSMRNIASACNCNEALLYRHFASKQELLLEVIARIQEGIDDEWLKTSQGAASGLEGLDAIITLIHNGAATNHHMYALTVHSLAALMGNPEMRPLISSGFGRQLETVIAQVKRGYEDGSILRKGNPNRCARCLLIRSLASSITVALVPDGPAANPGPDGSTDSLLECLTRP